MKNFLILGLLALFLFSVSAALSLWLNQAKQTDTTAEKEKEKAKNKEEKSGTKESKEAPESKAPIVPKLENTPSPLDSSAILREREEKLKYHTAQMDLVLRDLQVQRDATDSTLRQVLSELRNVGTETAKLDALAKDLKDKQLLVEAGEKKNIEKIAKMYDAMAPESAAPLMKEMVEKGKLDMVAKILVQMAERNAARVLDAMNDPALASQILSRVRDLRASPPAAPPAKGP